MMVCGTEDGSGACCAGLAIRRSRPLESESLPTAPHTVGRLVSLVPAWLT